MFTINPKATTKIKQGIIANKLIEEKQNCKNIQLTQNNAEKREKGNIEQMRHRKKIA